MPRSSCAAPLRGEAGPGRGYRPAVPDRDRQPHRRRPCRGRHAPPPPCGVKRVQGAARRERRGRDLQAQGDPLKRNGRPCEAAVDSFSTVFLLCQISSHVKPNSLRLPTFTAIHCLACARAGFRAAPISPGRARRRFGRCFQRPSQLPRVSEGFQPFAPNPRRSKCFLFFKALSHIFRGFRGFRGFSIYIGHFLRLPRTPFSYVYARENPRNPRRPVLTDCLPVVFRLRGFAENPRKPSETLGNRARKSGFRAGTVRQTPP